MAKGGGDQKSGKQNSAEPIPPIETREEIAKLAGVSRDTVPQDARHARPRARGSTVVKNLDTNGIHAMLARAREDRRPWASNYQ